MWSIGSIDGAAVRSIRAYPGLIGVLVYRSSAREFAGHIRDAYPELHVESGRSLLLLAGADDWVPPSQRRSMKMDVRRTMYGDRNVVGWVTSFQPPERIAQARHLVSLKEHFGLRSTDLPCLLLMEDVEDRDGSQITFEYDGVTATADSVTRQLSEVFDVCSAQVARRPCVVDAHDAERDPRVYNELIDWRRETLGRVTPELEKRKMFRSIKKVVPNAVGGAVAGLAKFVGGI